MLLTNGEVPTEDLRFARWVHMAHSTNNSVHARSPARGGGITWSVRAACCSQRP